MSVKFRMGWDDDSINAVEFAKTAENNGADGYINVEVLVDGELAATKMIAVSAGSFRVVTIPLTLDAGEHVITVGGMTANLTVE